MTFDNPARGRFNAWLFDALDGYVHAKYGARKTRLLGQVPETVVELGPGTGANLRYYPAGTRVIGVEPNVRMHDRLRGRAERRGLALHLLATGAESLPLPDASVDLVLATLVLCTVPEPLAALAEARRVLRPEGRFVCIEHVPAPAGSAVRRLQHRLARPWKWLFEGCHLVRDTEGMLRRAGFRDVAVEPFEVPTVFVPIRHQIAATCTA